MATEIRRSISRWPSAPALALLALLVAACSQQSAPSFPTRQVTLVIPWTAGTYADAVGRPAAELAAKQLGQPVTVSNVAGASGSLGITQVVQGAKDGYTLIQVNPGSLAVLPHVQALPYTLDSFEPIVQYAADPFFVLVQAGSNIKTAQEYVEQAKKTPGSISYSTPGVGTVPHLGMEILGNLVGTKFKHVPYQSSGEGVNALLGGHVTSSLSSATDVGIHVKEGRLRALMVFADKRDPRVPDVPTGAELGYKVSVGTWQGAAVPAGTPAAAIAKLRDVFGKTVQSQEFAAAYTKINAGVAYLDAEAFRAKWKAESEMFGKAVDAAGLKASQKK